VTHIKTSTSLIAILLCLVPISTNAVFAQEPITTFIAKCDGGSLPLAHATLVVRITSDEVVFVQGGRQFAIPVSKITFVAHGDPMAKTYLAGIQWAEPSGEIVLIIQRQDYNKVVAILKSIIERANPETVTKKT
jgi:hypothetical protein